MCVCVCIYVNMCMCTTTVCVHVYVYVNNIQYVVTEIRPRLDVRVRVKQPTRPLCVSLRSQKSTDPNPDPNPALDPGANTDPDPN